MDIKSRNALSLVSKLASASLEQQRQGVQELRLLSKWDTSNRTAIANAGGIPLLLALTDSSPDPKIQTNAVTALLNLSILPSNKDLIVRTPSSLAAILHALTAASEMEARENAAALLFSLTVVEDHRPVIGGTPGMIPALLDLLGRGSSQGKKDALKALFHIAMCHDNRSDMVEHGAVAVLASLLIQGTPKVVEDALAVLAQIAGCAESVAAFQKVSVMPLLVDLLDTGSPRAQENSASVLLNLCKSGGESVVEEVADFPSCISALSVMMANGSLRGKNKASSLLQMLVVG